MKKVLTKVIAIVLGLALILALVPGCGKKTEEKAAVVDTIYIGHHYIPEIDPTYVDPITGEAGMAPDKQMASLAALATVKEKLGVDIKWKQWTSSATQECLQTVLAGDPFCHMAVLSGSAQATVLTQNVLQPLDKYLDVFETEDTEWILMPQVCGDYYFMERDLIYVTDWPLVFNINMIEAVPELKDANGNTVFPYDLYQEGKWTWSVFEDYLDKIQRYYAGKKSANGNEITAFNTNYIYAVQQALHSNGASIYNGNSIGVDTPEAIEACEYLDGLMTKGLVSCSSASFGTTANNGGTGIDGYFRNGESVFTHMARWRMGGASNVLASRGESMGIMFWPRPDDVPFTGEEYVEGASQYEISKPACDAIGLLRGFNEEESHLAIEAYALYTVEFYLNMGRVDTIKEYRETMAPSEAITFGIDIFHPDCGEDNLAVFELFGRLKANDFAENMNLLGSFGVNIFGNSVYGVAGMPKYAAAIKANKATLYDRIDNISESLRKENAVDAVAPSVAQKDTTVPIVFPVGTNPDDINWAEYITASDNVDGTYDLKLENGRMLIKANPNTDDENSESAISREFEADRMAITISEDVDFNAPGAYTDGVNITVTDTFGNVGTRNFTIYLYDEHNTVAPTLVVKEGYSSIALESDTSTVQWGKLFTDKAEDVTGVDLTNFVSAEVSELDVTVPGEYPVTIYVEDFVGNRTEKEITVKVE